MKGDYPEALKKVNFFFLLNSIPFNGQSYQKQKGPGTSDQLLFSLQKQVQKNSFISYILSDEVQ